MWRSRLLNRTFVPIATTTTPNTVTTPTATLSMMANTAAPSSSSSSRSLLFSSKEGRRNHHHNWKRAKAAATRSNVFNNFMMKDNNGRAASSLASSSSSSLKKEEDEDQALLMASFDDLSADVREALENLNLQSPTEIQSLAIPSIRDKGGNVCIASHTGSGKTLAYLLPILDALKREEIEADGDRLAKSRRPRALIVSPTRELAEQIFAVTKSLSHYAKVSSRLILGGRPFALQKDNLEAPVDVVVGTPGRLVKHCEEKSLFLGSCKFVVLDEADTLFEAGFGEDVERLLRPVKNRNRGGDDGDESKKKSTTIVLVSATMPDRLKKLIDTSLPDVQYVKTQSLHKSAPGLKHNFVNVPGSEDKMKFLEDIVVPMHERGKRVMVFCNTVSSCVAVEKTMAERNVNTVQYHGDMSSEERVESMKAFCDADPEDDNLVLVCTDLAARGLDFAGVKVDNVVNFDFPLNPVDYIHRSGRTARAGAKGMVTNLISKRDKVLANEIDVAVRLGRPIDDATSSKAVAEIRKMKLVDERRRAKGKEVDTKKNFKSSNRGRRGSSRYERNEDAQEGGGRGGGGRGGRGGGKPRGNAKFSSSR